MVKDGVTYCRYCGAYIRFIKTQRGKTMPVDAEPVPFVFDQNGPNFYLDPEGHLLRGTPPREGENEETETGFISHFATCPDADKARKPRKSERKRMA